MHARKAAWKYWSALAVILTLQAGCSSSESVSSPGNGGGRGGSAGSGAAGSAGASGSFGISGSGGASGSSSTSGSSGAGGTSGNAATGGTSPGGVGGTGGGPPLGASVTVHLVPADGVTGPERVNFAVPLQPGQLSDASAVRVVLGDQELAAARRGLATYGDGSLRSVQLQVELDVAGETELEVRLGEAPTTDALTVASVDTTLVDPNGERGPRVWAVLPAAWLSESGFAGRLVPEADVEGTPSAAWATLCDYDRWNTVAFLDSGYETDRAVWLFDRGTALYRGYARRGELSQLRDAYVETSMYRNRITGTGTATRNGIPPDGAEDVKYAYSQNLALHYLLSGDDRYRESAEDIALGMSELWADPGYAGGSDFWTERHAGFGLLAYVWAMIVSDDQRAELEGFASEAVDAYLDLQETYPEGYTDADARCFAHTADAHGEGGEYFGCSPWMSAILADGLDQYGREVPERSDAVRTSLIKLGRIIAQSGIQPDGRPYYFMGVGTTENMLDEYDEHFGESAYLIGMAWNYSGRTDSTLRGAADALLGRLASDGTVPHVRSFNWQCRSAVQGPAFLE